MEACRDVVAGNAPVVVTKIASSQMGLIHVQLSTAIKQPSHTSNASATSAV